MIRNDLLFKYGMFRNNLIVDKGVFEKTTHLHREDPETCKRLYVGFIHHSKKRLFYDTDITNKHRI